jgi:glycosyltransferase involved in cell wall biosynthesis
LRTVYINGKFTAQPVTGVQRVAHNLVAAIDDHLVRFDRAGSTRWILLCPPAGLMPSLQRIEARAIGPSWARLTLWEQVFLPLASRGSLLLCLSGSAPAFKAGQACMIHDAAVFDTPQGYRLAFLAWYRFLFKRLAKTAALIVTVSDYSRQRLAHWLSLSAGKIAVVHNGADHLLACETEDAVLTRLQLRGRRYFLAVGSSTPNKNQQAIVQAFASTAPSHDLCLVLVGDVNKTVFATVPVAEGRGKRVVDAGRVTDRELKALYTGALALVFPSLSEGFGLPPLEAMLCGCPVIASNRGAIPEVCGDGALYADPSRVGDIADAMRRLLTDTALRERVRHNGFLRARSFTWANAAQTLLAHMAGAGLIGPPQS